MVPELTSNESSPSEFDHQFVSGGQPAVIRGGVCASSKCGEWNWEHLRQRVGEHRVRLVSSATGVFNPNVGVDVSEETLNEALNRLTGQGDDSQEHFYVMQQSIPDRFAELADEVGDPPLMPTRGTVRHTNLWLSGAGCVTPLHFDRKHNFLVQIEGRKELTLFHPKETPKLYPALHSSHRHISEVDLDAIDHERFPRFAEAVAETVILNPGEELFIPSGWWHHVRSLDAAISVNFFWNTPTMEWHARFDRLVRGIRKLGGSLLRAAGLKK